MALPSLLLGRMDRRGSRTVANFGFAAAGLKVSDRGFVDLAIGASPMFVLDFPVDDREPVGGEQGPITEGFTVDFHSHAGEHFGLPIVGKVAGEAVVEDFGDEAGEFLSFLIQETKVW